MHVREISVSWPVMKPYSQDLRERVIRELEAQAETQPEIAERFAVSVSLAALCEQVGQAGGPQVSEKTMCRELQRLKLPRKKSPSMRVSGRRRG